MPRRRPEGFDASQAYQYPAHLRAAVDGAPAGAGVYVFHGESDDLPLYIGKSVNLRARLLSHLRNPEEARLLRQTRRISTTRTAGEIGALLLEAQWIKQQHPLFNQKLRMNRQLCSLQLTGDRPEVVYSNHLDFAAAPALYGLFASRQAALEALRDLADPQRLCYGALGLEKLAAGKPCFRCGVGLCAGVCRGDETQQAHDQRLQDSLREQRVQPWPFAGAVALVERDADLTQLHVVRNWQYLGSSATLDEARQWAGRAAAFDADSYRILVRPVLSGGMEILPLGA